MQDIRKAILDAIAAADQLHLDFGAKELAKKSGGRVDVFGLLTALDIPVMFRPLKGLLGCYLNENVRGIMLTTQRPLSVQRFTAAHELGHAVLEHTSSLDDETVLNRTPYDGAQLVDWRELQANAFASELLTPRWLVAHHMKRQEWTLPDLEIPSNIYQLSLRMGSSYAATCHALLEHKAITKTLRDSLLRVQPKVIKQQLSKKHTPDSWCADIWVLGMADQQLLVEGSAHDTVILKLIEHAASGYMWTCDSLTAVGLHIVNDVRDPSPNDDAIGSVVSRTIVVESEQQALGHVTLQEQRPWLPNEKPLHSLEFNVDLTGPLQSGLLASQREALLGCA